MWFTIAFFTYPIAFFLTFKAFKNYKTQRFRNLIIASLIFITPIILFLIELRNLNEVTSDLKGIYVSHLDSLIITENKFILIGKTGKKMGTWELIDYDDLSICLTDEQSKTNELQIIYKAGKPSLTNEKSNYFKLD
jgi:hypothetical protein